MTQIKFSLEENIDISFIPSKEHSTDVGYDVRAACFEDIKLRSYEKVLIPLGFKMFMPDDWWAELRPRSSTFAKKHLHCLYGVIDPTYQGTVMLSCQYIPPPNLLGEPLIIKHGDKIAQLVFHKRNDVDISSVSNFEYEEMCKSRNASRGSGGFGSTGV